MYVVGDGNSNVMQATRYNPFFQYAGYDETLTDISLPTEKAAVSSIR
ncbi:hypothetical protein MM221_09735 [Salipaludibacillus sp. LMS25]|nr:hypothetical protein [Salipaludibacillus sp. LMS25]UTR16763.1 hypothetical protein MM221_09735 [Salipaludibacillus sp. LMS25]